MDAPSLTPLLFNNEGWSADGNDTLPIISGEFQFPSPDVPGSYRLLLFTPIPVSDLIVCCHDSAVTRCCHTSQRLGGPVIVTDVNARNVLGLSDGEIQLTPASSTVTTVDGYTLAAASTEFTYREAPSAGDSETTVLLRVSCAVNAFGVKCSVHPPVSDSISICKEQYLLVELILAISLARHCVVCLAVHLVSNASHASS